jgi:hypothetical protein
MMNEEVFDSIQKLGQKSYKEYYTVGGMLDIFSGIYLIAACYIISIHKVGYWLLMWWVLAIIIYAVQALFRKLIIVPRIGVAKFSEQIKEPRNYRMFYMQWILIFLFYTIWASVDSHFLPAANIVMILNFGIVPYKYAANIKYYLVLSFASIPFIYPYYHSDYENILLCAFFLLIFAVLSKWMWRNRILWEPKISYPKPRKLGQIVTAIVVSLAFEFLLFTIFRPDVTGFIRNWVAVNTTVTIGILSASLIAIMGMMNKTPRMYWYAAIVLLMSFLTPLSYRIHMIPGFLLLVAGLMIVTSGGVILRNFIKNNPIIMDENFLEDKVLNDTK